MRVKERGFTHLDQFYVSCLWFAYNLMWGALLALVLPSQVEAIVGSGQKEKILGMIGGMGAFVALVVSPISGALSDRSRNPIGRRRPFLLAGVILNCLALLFAGMAGVGTPLVLFVLAYLAVQLGCNWWGGPYAGLIPDVVPKEHVGRASGWQALMTAVGFLTGALAAGKLIQPGRYFGMYVFIAVVLVAMMALTWFGVRERQNTRDSGPFQLGPFLRSFLLDPVEYRDFYWVLITRALVTMGVYSIFFFFQYFLADIVKVKDPLASTSILVGAIMAAGIPTSIVAGILSDKHGRKPLVYLSGGLMALACLVYIGVSYHPSWEMTLIVATVFGIGNGAYQAVDWALAVDVLPGGEDAAKDMGIWHVAIVLPQIVAPVISGLILDTFKHQGQLLLGYTVVFACTAVWFILGTVFVRQIRGVR